MNLTEELFLALEVGFPGCLLCREPPGKETPRPWFYVRQTGEEQRRMPGGRRRIQSAFLLEYHPGEAGEQGCKPVADQLFSLVAVLGGTVRCSKMSWSVAEGVLQFLAEYLYFGREVEEKTRMEELRTKTTTGG